MGQPIEGSNPSLSATLRFQEARLMTLPYKEPLEKLEPGPRVIPEPPRRGEPGGEPCAICAGETTKPVWSDDHWTLHPASGGSIPGTVWMASKAHVDSFSDLPDDWPRSLAGHAALSIGRS